MGAKIAGGLAAAGAAVGATAAAAMTMSSGEKGSTGEHENMLCYLLIVRELFADWQLVFVHCFLGYV